MPEEILLSGHARFPKGALAHAIYDILTITATVRTPQWTITDAETTLLTDVAQQYVRRCLIGTTVLRPIEEVDEELDGAVLVIEEGYAAGAKKTVIAALRDLYRRAAEAHRAMQEEGPTA